jgi:DNA-binding transcriptional LysR family regulator
MDTLSAMVVFARVVEEESFSSAARRLGVSKATVSKEVARLEDHLGVRLLNRTTRRLSLTDVGQAFYERCARIVEEAEEAERAVTTWQSAPRGLLRVSAPVSFGRTWVAPHLPRFLAKYPDLKLELSLNDRFVDLIEEGFDVAIRIARLPDSSLIARRLSPSNRAIYAAPAYLKQHGTPAHPRDLTRHNCLTYSLQATGDAWRLDGPGGEVSVRVDGSFRANNGEALVEAACAGLGIVMCPDFLAGDSVASGKLVRILPEWSDHTASVYAVHPHVKHVPIKVRVFVDFLASQCQEATAAAR